MGKNGYQNGSPYSVRGLISPGDTFAKLTVVKQDGRTKGQKVKWLCECECGGTTHATTYNLRSGRRVSCGCGQSKKGEGMQKQVPSWKHAALDAERHDKERGQE